MSSLRPIFWHQGLFLQPQHFQHAESLALSRLVRLLDLTTPHAWGVMAAQLEESALANNQVVFSRLSVLMRDGTLIDFPGNATLDVCRFEPTQLGDGKTLYLGLRRMMPDQPNVSVFADMGDAPRADTRYAASSEPLGMEDVYAGGPQGQVDLLSYVLRLFWEDDLDARSQYELLPVARIELDGERVQADKLFVPPCLNLEASPQLLWSVRQLRDELFARSRQLEVFKPSNAAKVRDADASHMNLLAVLAVLNRQGAHLQHLLGVPQTHPWQIDGMLRQLLAELSTFSDRCNLLGETRDGTALAPPYDHENPAASLRALADLIRALLNEIAAAPEMLLRLQPVGPAPGYYTAELPDGFFGARHRYHLVATGEFDSDGFAALLSQTAKMGAPLRMERLVTHALPGIELIHLPEAPRGVPRRPQALYYLIDHMSESWAEIEEAGEIALFVPDVSETLQLEIIVSKW